MEDEKWKAKAAAGERKVLAEEKRLEIEMKRLALEAGKMERLSLRSKSLHWSWMSKEEKSGRGPCYHVHGS